MESVTAGSYRDGRLGLPRNFVPITRYNSWQDLAADRAAPPNADGWKQTRDHTASHHDTIADRVAPK